MAKNLSTMPYLSENLHNSSQLHFRLYYTLKWEKFSAAKVGLNNFRDHRQFLRSHKLYG